MFHFKLNSTEIPKYQQIVNGIINAIQEGTLKKGDQIPSLNFMVKEHSLSQDTVLNAYNHLKSRGILSSAVGKGYFIKNDDIQLDYRVFLLFDNFTLYKEDLFNAISKGFEGFGQLDIYFHHNNKELYKKILGDISGKYTHYIIMPIETSWLNEFTIHTLPKKNVYLLDRGSATLGVHYPYVCQNFEKDVIKALNCGIKIIKKYSRINLITPSQDNHFELIIRGLKAFSLREEFELNIYSKINNLKIETNTLFVVIRDRDLAELILKIEEEKMIIGKDVGIISYNENPLKQVIKGGISTISTDFKKMGQKMVEMVLENKRKRINNPVSLIVRKSI